jgi:hypothetical protein
MRALVWTRTASGPLRVMVSALLALVAWIGVGLGAVHDSLDLLLPSAVLAPFLTIITLVLLPRWRSIRLQIVTPAQVATLLPIDRVGRLVPFLELVTQRVAQAQGTLDPNALLTTQPDTPSDAATPSPQPAEPERDRYTGELHPPAFLFLILTAALGASPWVVPLQPFIAVGLLFVCVLFLVCIVGAAVRQTRSELRPATLIFTWIGAGYALALLIAGYILLFVSGFAASAGGQVSDQVMPFRAVYRAVAQNLDKPILFWPHLAFVALAAFIGVPGFVVALLDRTRLRRAAGTPGPVA